MTIPTDPPGRRARNKLDKRRRIRAAARDLFHRQGYAETSVGQVARAAEVAEGTLFLYVSRKEDLLVLALADELADAVEAAFGAVDDQAGFVTQVAGFFGALLAYHRRDVTLSKLFLREVGVLRDPGRDYGFGAVPMMDRLAAIVRRRQAVGEIAPDHDASAIARLCFAVYWGTLRDWANDALTAEGFDRELRCLLGLACLGLGAPAGR